MPLLERTMAIRRAVIPVTGGKGTEKLVRACFSESLNSVPD